MLLSKINSLAHLRAAPCNDLHATKLAPGKRPPRPGWGWGWGGGGWTLRVGHLGARGPALSPLLPLC